MPRSATAPVVVTELELKFDVPEGFVLPDLGSVRGAVAVETAGEQALDATYFDTHDLRLGAARLTLRRRTGGSDAGWHLKRPRSDGARDELRVPLGRASRTVPAALRSELEVHARGAALAPVVRLSTHRRLIHLIDEQGLVLAEVADDLVSASVPTPDGRSTQVCAWREVEVELVRGPREILDSVAKVLRRAGARPSSSRSKLARALGERWPSDPVTPDLEAGSAGTVVLAHLREHVERLTANDPLVRADRDDAVHQMRVAARRLRSALSTYRPLFDRAVTDPLREELQWLGSVLGAARDAEVVRDHLRDLVAAEPADLVLGEVVLRIVATLGARYRAAHDEVLVELGQARYFALLDRLDALLADPPLSGQARLPADEVLLPLVARTFRATRRLVVAADAAADGAARDLLLHDVRKAAKRARYAGESLVAAYGRDAARFAARMAAVQEVLGDHQDSVVVRGELRRLAIDAFAAGENSFTYGRLHALEQARGEHTEAAFALAWEQAGRPHWRSWLEPAPRA